MRIVNYCKKHRTGPGYWYFVILIRPRWQVEFIFRKELYLINIFGIEVSLQRLPF